MAKTFAQLPGYHVGVRLGKGAGAVIYSAVERSSRRKVAVKHVVRHGPAEDRFIAQAETEYEIARQLKHRYLRQYFDLVRVRRWLKTSELFLIMELVEGERLEDRYAERRPVQFEEVVGIFEQIAEGLHAMHRAGFVHADMKPNNVMLSAEGVKIIDFGQSCALGSTKERVQGTPDYIAPEQVRREPLDQRTDVFNLGATMYRVVTGKAFATILPAAPAGALKIDLDGRRGNTPPHEMNPAVPLSLSRLIIDCCAADKDQRPWDMTVVQSRLGTVRHYLARRAESHPAQQAKP